MQNPHPKVKLYIATSLDGKIARKDGSIDWLPDPTTEDYGYHEFYNSVDTVIMGYHTYEISLGFGAEGMHPNKTTYVFSRDTSKTVAQGAELINRNPVEFIKELKAKQGGDIWLVGGGQIIALLHDAGLIDEYIIAYIPVILGEGIELFPRIKKEINLKLTKSKVYKNGLAMLYLEQ